MIKRVLKKLETERLVTIRQEELKEFLKQGEIVKEINTLFCGHIRLIEISNKYLIQEQTNKSEIIIRKILSLSKAEEFLENRLRTYDRMWDGCGCKIDYYE